MAMPGILQQIANANPMMQRIRQMMGAVNNAKNPQEMMNQLVSSNPQMKQVMDLINQSGGDPKSAFYKLAEQRGVNPNDILDMLKNG